jgi:DUF4097 and DUF4098 domain-containing protein YvlB
MKVGYLNTTAVFLMLISVPAFAGKSVDESWVINLDASISIENIAGTIEIEGWNLNEARLTGELGDSVDELEISASNSNLVINVDNRNSRNVDNTELKLMVPEGASVDASAVSADIEISGLDNEKVTASSVSGEVEVDVKSNWVSIESVSGDVGFSGRTQRISAESVSGDVELTGISGDIAATTVSGDLELVAGLIESGRLETVSGDMNFTGELTDNGRLTAESMSGDVTINLPADQSGLFKAESFSGRITTDFGSVDRAKHGPGSHLKYTAGSSGAEIRVESFSGNIDLISD